MYDMTHEVIKSKNKARLLKQKHNSKPPKKYSEKKIVLKLCEKSITKYSNDRKINTTKYYWNKVDNSTLNSYQTIKQLINNFLLKKYFLNLFV